MNRGKRIVIFSLLVLVTIGILVFLLGPGLFASVAYPLPEKYKGSIAKWTKEYCTGISDSAHLLSGLIMAESGWREGAASYAGAIGMTQFIPSTAVAVAGRLGISPFTPSDLTRDSDLSIRFGAYYICTRIKDYGGNVKLGLIAYNGGGGAVNAYLAGTPVSGTVGYADKVMRLQRAYKSIYGDWWRDPKYGGEPINPNEPFDVFPKTETSVVGSISIIDFWQGLLSNDDAPETAATEEPINIFNFWKIFIPGQ
ncbi:transglycosylase SLT domain-containing protein [Candidatus Berkelbacteria bacterium]|nr:transglycosylase SLT domain-containing protein [Candidatus Berkelbacteria bacterium]